MTEPRSTPALEIAPTAIAGPIRLKPRRFGDTRGWFEESWNQASFAEAGLDLAFVQDNQSLSRQVGTIRGLHFQTAPSAQAKLVRVLAGRIFDVAVDLRPGSPTRGRHVAVELDSESGWQFLVPTGFAHGFCTLAPDTVVAYKVTGLYSKPHDGGMRWNDPALGIAWPVDEAGAVVSDKDKVLPLLADLPADLDLGRCA